MDSHPSSSTVTDFERRALLGVAGLAGMAAIVKMAHAGPINPPAGPVASTAKPLAEIEARTAINATNTPGDATAAFIISTEGSYYLTGDVFVAAGKIGIKVLSSALNVTIDLNGFRIYGFAGSGVGIQRPTGLGGSTLLIRNGFILGLSAAGISADSQNSLVENVSVSDCAGVGFDVGGECARFVHCAAFRNGSHGFNASTAVFDSCVASNNTGIGYNATTAVFNSCLASFNAGGGFKAFFLQATNCTASTSGINFLGTNSLSADGCRASGGTAGFSCSSAGNVNLSGCLADTVSGNGFDLAGVNGGQLNGCLAKSCSGVGFALGSGMVATSCAARLNTGGGFTGSGCTFSACAAISNGSAAAPASGFLLGQDCRVENCSANSNFQHGISASSRCTITNCSAMGNGNSVAGNAGIRLTDVDSAIDSCTVTQNAVGIATVVGQGIITRNRLSGNTANYSLAGTNFVGAAVTAAGSVATANAWANFEF